MRGRLNIFQKTMIQWNAWHPYNAVHGVRVPGRVDLPRLRQCVREALERWGLTGLELDPSQGCYCYHGGPAATEPFLVAGGDNPELSLAVEVERQLNTPFSDRGRIEPFRCFVVPAANSFWLCLAFLHAMADATSIVGLLADVAKSLNGTVNPAGTDRSPVCSVGRDRPWLRHPMALARRLAALPAQIRAMRASSRPPCPDPADGRNGFILFSLQPSDLDRLRRTAKAWEVTVNDVVLALLMKALSVLAPASSRTGRRSRISIGNIVNVREDLAQGRQRGFGVFLGSFIVTHAVPDGITVRDLACDIRGITLPIKERRLYLGMPLELAVARLALRFFPGERKQRFFHKYSPLWAGVSNMNLNALWEPPAGQNVPDYFRAVSTGPATPLVLSLTTAGAVANLGLSYRTMVYAQADIELAMGQFVKALREEGVRA
jgi:hypothetical protein